MDSNSAQGRQRGKYSGWRADVWCVNSKSSDADKACAKDFLNWLYQSEEGKKIVVEEFNFIPAYTNYGDIKPKDPLGATVNEYANAGKTAPWVFMGEPTAGVKTHWELRFKAMCQKRQLGIS